jgi:Domain of unknown function (DUF4190)/Protein of unknown function (DUF2510)
MSVDLGTQPAESSPKPGEPAEPSAAPPGSTMPPAGWYPEPGTGIQRWWTGSSWGDYAVSAPMSPPVTAVSTRGTNGMAIASLVLGLLWGYGLLSILAIIFGAIGMKQTGERNQSGRGLAIAGLVLGIVGAVIALVVIIAAASATNTGY